MVTTRLLPRLAVLVAVAVGLTAVAVTRSIGPFRVRPPVTTSPVTEPYPFRLSREPNPALTTDQEKPAYEGPLGDFIVGRHQGSSLPPCPQPYRPAKSAKIKASELYSPVFGEMFGDLEGFVTECADGKITVIEIYGREIIDRVYFVGKPIVPYQAPLDRLKLLTVAGKPAIVQLPTPRFQGDLRLDVIERFPNGNQLGILVGITNTFKTLDEAADLAARIMAVR